MPSSRRTKRKKRKRRQGPSFTISKETQLDILGILLFAVGFLTVLAFLSPQQGLVMGPWVSFLSRTFGWGCYIVPIFIAIGGLYLVMRRFGDQLPRLHPRHVGGVILLFLTLLTTIHFPVVWITRLEPMAAAGLGYGGGYLGAGLGDLLVGGVGPAGAGLVLLAAWVLAVYFTFDISPAAMLRGLMGLARRIRWARRPVQLPPGLQPAPTPSEPRRRTVVRKAAQLPTAAPLPPVHPPTVVGGPPWTIPPVDGILEPGDEQDLNQEYMRRQARIIEETLASLGAPVKVKEVNRGPVVTQFGVEPLFVTNRRGQETRVKVSKITGLQNDLALALSARSIRIQAPVPRKGLIGIEVPNPEISLVALREIVESDAWNSIDSSLRLALGQDVSGAPFVTDLRAMPHLLIAGTTGSGKSVCINAILTALLLQNSPESLKLLMVDPKRVELSLYNGIPHLLSPVVVDMERVVGALKWVLREMDGRYRRFASVGARDIEEYNTSVVPERDDLKRMPYIVVVVDELADLMMLAPQETERVICRLAQKARATGIHLIIATQRPSVDVVTGLIKANFPARIAFAVASSVDSRVILDSQGAEQLLGRGDMLLQLPNVSQPIRLQGAFVSDTELYRLVHYWKGSRVLEPAPAEPEPAPAPAPPPPQEDIAGAAELLEDDLFPDALEILLAENRASISLLQRRLRIGYTRSARIMDLLTEKRVVGPPQPGGQAREIDRELAQSLLRRVRKEGA